MVQVPAHSLSITFMRCSSFMVNATRSCYIVPIIQDGDIFSDHLPTTGANRGIDKFPNCG